MRDFINEIKSSQSIAELHEALQTLVSPDGILTEIAGFLNANQVDLENDDGVAWQFYKPPVTLPHTTVEILEITDDRSDDESARLLDTRMESGSARI